jgi:hypothetical protein
MTPRRPIGVQVKGALTGCPPFSLLVAWESYMSPSRMAMHFFYSHPDKRKTYLSHNSFLVFKTTNIEAHHFILKSAFLKALNKKLS